MASIKITKTNSSRLGQTDFSQLKFGNTFSDHMLVVDYENNQWHTPEIVPYQNFSFSPALASIHYGISVFEGLKAYRWKDGSIYMFRPEMHAKRLNLSGARICIPQISEEVFLDGIKELVKLDKGWIPESQGSSLYIRPTLMSTDEFLGVAPSKTFKFFVITCPVSSYYDGMVKLKVETKYSRATAGGTGYIKMGGNYAASLLPTQGAIEEGFDQILWTDCKEHKYIEEVGTMNIVFQIGDTIVTPKSDTILESITRLSVMSLAEKWGLKTEHRQVSVREIFDAYENGLLKDAFGTGTAATITHVSELVHEGKKILLPPKEERDFSNKAGDYLNNLKYGKTKDYMNWMVKVL